MTTEATTTKERNMEATATIPANVLTEAKRLLDFYSSDEADYSLTTFRVTAEPEICIAAEFVDSDGYEHDEFQVFDPDGELIQAASDGVSS